MPDRWDAEAKNALCCCGRPRHAHTEHCPAMSSQVTPVAALARRAYREALERAAALHESVSPRCDHEPTTGAGAMRAVIEYRDAIRREIEGA